MRRTLLILILAPMVIGCGRSFTLFDLEDTTGDSSVAVTLRERTGVPTEREGELVPGQPLVLNVDRDPLSVTEPSALVAYFDGSTDGMSLEARGENDDSLGTARGALLSGGRSAIMLFVPGGRTISSVTITRDGGSTDSVRVVGLELRAPFSGAGSVEPASTGVPPGPYRIATPGTRVFAWGSAESGSRWEVGRGDSGFWGADDPIEVAYDYKRAGATPDGADSVVVPTALVESGASSLELDLRPGRHRVVLYSDVDPISASSVAITTREEGVTVTWIGPASMPSSATDPIPADPGTLLRYPPSAWRERDYELFEWTLFPDVLVLDTRSYDVQARFFRRLAFFVEKTGFRGTLLTDAQLAGRHGYNAHNYNGEGLASFFQAATDAGFELSPEEKLLRTMVVDHGIVHEQDGKYVAGTGGILGISQESAAAPALRDLLLAHESYHGVYYSVPAYVSAVGELWSSLDRDEQRYWKLLFTGMAYDVSDEYLLHNEFQAYLMQQPVASATWYFESLSADRMRRWFPSERDWVDRFLATHSGLFRDLAVQVQQSLFRTTGLVARDVFDLEQAGAGAR